MWSYKKRSAVIGVIGAILLVGFLAQYLGWISFFRIPEIWMLVFSAAVLVNSLAEVVNRRRGATGD